MGISKTYIIILLIIGLFGLLQKSSIAQIQTISLEEAMDMAINSYPGLKRDQLSIDQQNQLAEAGPLQQPTQLFLSSEEFGVNNQSGIHSLNVQQNFYLPKVGQARKSFFKQGAEVAASQKALTAQELIREVKLAYYQLLYAKEERKITDDNTVLYNNFLKATTKQLKTGETGIIPQLAARSRLGHALLEQEHAKEKYQIALALFNQWINKDEVYDVSGQLDTIVRDDQIDSLSMNPHLQIIEARRRLAAASIEMEKSKLLPQINSGVQLQTASGNFPLFGYQIGVNVPLFKKAYQGRIKAAELGVQMQEASFKTKEQELNRNIIELRYRIQHQRHILNYIKEDYMPIVEQQSTLNLKAYNEGEVNYLEYLDGLEQVVKVKHQYLKALFDINILQVELRYWLGK